MRAERKQATASRRIREGRHSHAPIHFALKVVRESPFLCLRMSVTQKCPKERFSEWADRATSYFDVFSGNHFVIAPLCVKRVCDMAQPTFDGLFSSVNDLVKENDVRRSDIAGLGTEDIAVSSLSGVRISHKCGLSKLNSYGNRLYAAAIASDSHCAAASEE